MNPKISVIIPVYKVERFLDYCVKSVVNQTYKKLEIILVDDGSPDNCPQICDEWALRDSRIRTVHRVNGGLSCARNTGLSVATGDFIVFLDSDDWIAPNTVEYSLKLLKENDADLVQYQIYETSVETYSVHQPKVKNTICKNRDEIIQFYMTSTTSGVGGDYSVCQCLFPKWALEGESFRIGKINEDIDFKYRVLSKCKKMVVTNQYKYFYRQGEVTTSMGGLKKKDFDLYEVGNILAELTSKEKYGAIAFLGKVKQARTPLSLLCKIAYFGIADPTINKSEIVNKLLKEHRANLSILLKSPLPLSRKILALLFAVNYKLTETCIKLVK